MFTALLDLGLKWIYNFCQTADTVATTDSYGILKTFEDK